MKNVQFWEKVPPVNSEVLIHLKNIESPVIVVNSPNIVESGVKYHNPPEINCTTYCSSELFIVEFELFDFYIYW
jgi:hypothetical protein